MVTVFSLDWNAMHVNLIIGFFAPSHQGWIISFSISAVAAAAGSGK